MNRRMFNSWLCSLPLQGAVLGSLYSSRVLATSDAENLAPIGMGTWITFDHNPKQVQLQKYIDIVTAFFKAGGQMIDSSPMYGYAQQLLGKVLSQVSHQQLMAATKVWIMGEQMGIEQMHQSIKLWGVQPMDLMYVHNLLDWQTHLPTLNEYKKEGVIKHTGLTTSHGRRHDEMVEIIQKHPVDFIQLSYNIHDRVVEQRLLPMAMDKGINVVANRPFQTGGLFTRVAGKPLPDWAQEIQCDTWAQFFLKFIIAHPAISCAIPATSQVSHMKENMQVMKGAMPNAEMRAEMVAYYEQL